MSGRGTGGGGGNGGLVKVNVLFNPNPLKAESGPIMPGSSSAGSGGPTNSSGPKTTSSSVDISTGGVLPSSLYSQMSFSTLSLLVLI